MDDGVSKGIGRHRWLIDRKSNFQTTKCGYSDCFSAGSFGLGLFWRYGAWIRNGMGFAPITAIRML